MNKVYNVIWSVAKNALVVVAEGTKSSTKSSVRGLRVLVAFLLLAPAIGSAATLPEGGIISIGEGTIVDSGTGQLTIKQTTDKLGINWQSFNVGPDGRVVFEQPNQNSIALNRVIGSDGSSILGRIDANGQVFLINPNGVVFGQDAKVNVGGIVASTMDISDTDFVNGNYKFQSQTSNGEVINNGEIVAAQGGYVAILGKTVKNNGLIKAQLGKVALAAGDAVNLDFNGDGLLSVQVTASAIQAQVDNQGLIEANGGTVLMTAKATNALLDTVVNNEGIIRAQTISSQGGKITLDGGDSGTVNIAGTLDTTSQGADSGGMIDISGSTVKVRDTASISAASESGSNGLLVIQSSNFTIGEGSDAIGSIGGDVLGNVLATTNAKIVATAGDVKTRDAITWNSDSSLTLSGSNDVVVGGDISLLGTSSTLNIEHGNTSKTQGFRLENGAKVNLTGAETQFTDNGNGYVVIRTADDLQKISESAGNENFVLAGDIDASATKDWNDGKGYQASQDTFTSTFDGLGHSINDLTIKNDPAGAELSGLIGKAQSATIKNLDVNGSVSGNSAALVVVDATDTDIHNVSVSGDVSGNLAGGILATGEQVRISDVSSDVVLSGKKLGGIAGTLRSSTLSDATIVIDATGSGSIGGVAAEISGSTLTNISSSGQAKSTGSGSVGGVVGLANSSSFESISSSVDVAGGSAGGVAGTAYSSTFKNSYSTGNASGSGYVGGLIGFMSFYTQVDTSFATGNATSISGNAGGLTGYAGSYTKIKNAYASGSVNGNISGGLIGEASGVAVTNSYSSGSVSGTTATGGLVGLAEDGSTFTGTFWDTDKSGLLNAVGSGDPSDGITGKTTEQLHSIETFESWDISDTGGTGEAWRIYDGATGPMLRFAMKQGTVDGGDVSIVYSGGNVTKDALTAVDSTYGAGAAGLDSSLILGGDTHSGGQAIRNAGTYTADNFYSTQFGYDLVQNGASTVTVEKAALEVSVTDAQTKVYDGTTGATVGALYTALGSDSVSVAVDASFADKNAGAGKIVNIDGITLSGDDGANYYVVGSPTQTTGEITKANLDVSASAADRVYDGSVNADVSLGDNRIAGDDLSITYGSASFQDKNAGDGKIVSVDGISITGSDAGNYTWNTDANTSASISKAHLVLESEIEDKVYDGTTNAYGYFSNSGIVAGESIFVGATSTFADKNAGTGKEVTTTFTVSGDDAANYYWDAVQTSTADITKRTLNVTASADDKVYDATTAAQTTLQDNRVAGDLISVSSSGSAFEDKNAGTGKTVNVTGISVTGDDASNYAWSSSVSTTADIGKAQLSVTATADGKNYDGTTTATAHLTDNRITGDNLVLSYGQADFSDKNAGTSKDVIVSGITVAGADAGNYEWNDGASATASVGQAVLLINATGHDKVYDGTSDATVSFTDTRFGADDLVITAGDVQFVDKNADTDKQISVSGISISGADASNYVWDSTAVATADISKATLDVGAIASGKTYDGTTSVSTTLTDNRIAGDILTVSASSAFADKNAGAGKTVNIGGITVSGLDAGNYEWNNSATTTADIAKAALVVDVAAAGKDYDGTTAATAILSDNRIAGDSLTLGYGSADFADKNAGVDKDVLVSGITVSGTDAGNYEWNSTGSTTADIGRAVLTITANGVDKVYDGTTAAQVNLEDGRFGDDDILVTASDVQFADKNAEAGKQVSVSGITVTGADANNYIWDSTAVATADINKATLVISATASDKVYDGTTAADTSLSDNRIGTDNLVISGSGAFTDKNAGADKDVVVSGISVTGVDAGNYEWSTSVSTTADIAKAQLDVTATAASKDYDSTTDASAFLSDNRVAGDSLTLSYANANFSDKNAGMGKDVTVDGITIAGADAGNYEWNSSATTQADIGRAHLTISATGKDKVYDGTVNASVDLTDDRFAGDDLQLSADQVTFVDKNAEAGKQISVSGITLSGADADNYIWDSTAVAEADINKAVLNIIGSAADKVYDGSVSASTGLSDNRVAGDDLVITSASSAFSGKNAGTGKTVTIGGIDVSGTDAQNYTWSESVTTTANVSKAQLDVTAAAASKDYDSTTDADAFLSDNRVSGDSLVLNYGSATFEDKNAGVGKVVTVDGITVGGADAGNYEFNTSTETTADIGRAVLTITAQGIDKTYDGTTTGSVTLTDDRYGSEFGLDDLVISASDVQFIDKNAEAGKQLSVSGITVTGADANNYIWDGSLVATADINKATLDVSGIASGKTYDGTTSASTNLTDNRIAGDNLVVTSSSSAFSDKNAGNSKTVTIGGISVTGADAQNYTWNESTTATADIAKAQLDITSAAAGKDYDSTTDASAFLSDNRIAGDSLTLSYGNASFEDKNAGVGKTVTVEGITVSGADAGNYDWNSSSTTTADIGRAVLTITGTGVSKTYDGTTAGTVILADNRLGDDDLVVTADDTQFIDKNAEVGKQLSVSGINVSGADAGNYIWDASLVATADINKASLTVGASAADKTYDGTTGVSTSLTDNRIGSDDLVISANAAFSDKNAGEDKLVNITGIAVTGADAANYTWNTDATASADIAKAHLDITSAAESRNYDGTTSANAILNDDRILGDKLTVSYGQAEFSDKNAGMGKDVTISGINVEGEDAGNYEWSTSSTTTADIGKAVLSVGATGVDKVYDGTADASIIFNDNRLGSDDLLITADDVRFVDKNAEESKQISVAGITITGADAGNYIWDTTAVTSADIDKAVLNVSAIASDKVYDGSTSATASLSDNRIAGDSLAISSGGAAFSDKNAGEGKDVTIGGITVGGTDAGNYTWNSEATTTASIDKAQLVIDAAGVNKTYDSTTDATALLSDNRIAGDDLSITYGQAAFADKNAGANKDVTVTGITVSGTDAQNYVWNASDSTTATIDKAVLTVGATGHGKTYDGTTDATVDFTDNRFENDDLSVSASSAAFSDKNAGTGKSISVSGIQVAGADAGNYIWNTDSSTTADIAKAALTISAVAQDKVYDTTTSALVNLSDDRIAGDDLTITGNGAFSDKNAGENKDVSVTGIAVTGTDAGNYTWSTMADAKADISKASLTVTATASDKTYDGTTTASTALTDNRLGSDDLTIAAGSSVFSDKNAATGKLVTVNGITVSGADASNYTWNSSATTTGTINKAILTISADAQDKVYDGSRNASASFSDDRITGDDLTISAGSALFSDKSAGENKLVTVDGLAVAGADASNYTWSTSATAVADIDKAHLNVSAVAQDKVYDGTTGVNYALSDDRVAGDDLVLSSGGAAFSDKNAGTGKAVIVSGVELAGADAGNYEIDSSVATSATINKAVLTVGSTASDKVYDGTVNATASLTDNRIAGDDLSLSYGSASFSDKNAADGKTVTVGGITVSGADAGNYLWNASDTTTADISKAALSISASGVDKVYDGSVAAGVTLSDNRVTGDQLNLAAGSSVFSDKNAGTGKTITVDGLTVTGADAGNYTWVASTSATANITKRALEVSAIAGDKVYDGTASASATLDDNRIEGDDLVVTSAGASFSDKNAGANKDVTVGGVSVSGVDSGNYTWSSTASGTASISKATLVVAADAKDKVYDGSSQAQATFSDNRIAGDQITVGAATASFSDKNAGDDKIVTVSGITLTGQDAGNYEVNSVAMSTATIEKATLSIGASASDKVYDGKIDATVALTDNRIAGDDLVITSSGASFSDKNAGTGKVVSVGGIVVSGTDADNYVWNTYATSSADIAKAKLTVSGAVQDKTYDGTTQATIDNLTDNRVSGDDLVVTANGASFADKNAGSKTVYINGVTVEGGDAHNYDWDSIAISAAEIKKAFLNLAASGKDKVYDGTTSAEVTVTDDRIAGDSLNIVVGSAAFDNKNAGTSKNIIASGISLTGQDAGNYTVTDSLTAQADIAKADLTISASNQVKVTGALDPSLTWKVTDGKLFSGDAVSGGLKREAGEAAGTYVIGQGSLSAGENYNLSFVDGSMRISDAPISAPTDVSSITSTVSRKSSKDGRSSIQAVADSSDYDPSGDYKLINFGIMMPGEDGDDFSGVNSEVEIIN
ncbi:YDG domain-containing protein [Pseudomonas putida]|uniref:Filamentous hemagglutinin N-terminal domain-containing protein n=1 Tax=Pseudomonas putida TaxID=303 RepID=A0A8I1EAY2_PSEPU|nr:YDG domain-containing protein [Pseudomonas putida]MBI6882395.1 filamentous hemagglutinin N-terminal domain-containing protein [Pseudomonas putida]